MMPAEVIDISEKMPHITGETICLVCGDRGIAVAPEGVVFMECEKCGTMKCVFKYPCLRDGLEWSCNCGNTLFHVKPEGIYCPNCGVWQEGF